MVYTGHPTHCFPELREIGAQLSKENLMTSVVSDQCWTLRHLPSWSSIPLPTL